MRKTAHRLPKQGSNPCATFIIPWDRSSQQGLDGKHGCLVVESMISARQGEVIPCRISVEGSIPLSSFSLTWRGREMTRQQFLECQIAKYSCGSKLEHRLQRINRKNLEMTYHGMYLKLQYKACGEYYVTVTVNGEEILQCSLAQLKDAIRKGFRVCEDF